MKKSTVYFGLFVALICVMTMACSVGQAATATGFRALDTMSDTVNRMDHLETDVNRLKDQYIVRNDDTDYMNVKFKPTIVVCKTIEGDFDLTGVYKIEDFKRLQTLVNGKWGLKAKYSKKPRTNIVVLDESDAQLFVRVIKIANRVNSRNPEPVGFEVVPMSTENLNIPSLENLGICKPVILLVQSTKQRLNGGFWKRVSNFLLPFQQGAEMYNNIRSITLWG